MHKSGILNIHNKSGIVGLVDCHWFETIFCIDYAFMLLFYFEEAKKCPPTLFIKESNNKNKFKQFLLCSIKGTSFSLLTAPISKNKPLAHDEK